MPQTRSIYQFISAFFLSLIVVFFTSSAGAEKTKLSLGGKGISGPIFPTAGTIAGAVNRQNDDLHITVQARRGSTSVIESVIAGDFAFGVVQNSIAYQAYNGLARWNGRPYKKLRSICNVYPEQVVLVASLKSGIRNIGDLRGRRVFIGGSESDLLYAINDILSAAGINPQKDIIATGVAAELAPQMMQDDALDAFFFTAGVTNRALLDLFSGRFQVVLVPLTGIGIDELLAANPFYEKSVVAASSYPLLDNQIDVVTVSVKAALITSADLSDTLVYAVTKTVFGSLDDFAKQYPAAKVLTRRVMIEGLVAPLHPGADTFYRQEDLDYQVLQP